jgi:hypothetical protein
MGGGGRVVRWDLGVTKTKTESLTRGNVNEKGGKRNYECKIKAKRLSKRKKRE